MKSFKPNMMSSMTRVLTAAIALLATACLEIKEVPDKDEICAEGYQFDEETEKCVQGAAPEQNCGEQASYDSETGKCVCHGSGVFDEKTLSCTCDKGSRYEIATCDNRHEFDENGDEIEPITACGVSLHSLGDGPTYQTSGECIDIDECAGENPCGEGNTCINTKGAYRCECAAGFKPDQDADGNPTCKVSSICDANPEICADQPHTHCVQKGESYSCECDDGFDRGQGMFATGTCNDIDECSRNENLCGAWSESCENTEGSFVCHCLGGKTTEGEACNPCSEGEEHRTNSDSGAESCVTDKGFEFVVIRGGTFTMGDDEVTGAGSERQVTVPTFQIAKTEVTVGQYRACIEAGVCTLYNNDHCEIMTQSADHDDEPIRCVTWSKDISEQFLAWAGARLPTEAEWEYAARDEASRPYPWPYNMEPSRALASLYDEADPNPHGVLPVCSFTQGNTPEGLCDMAGNVAEWVLDSYSDDLSLYPTDGSAYVTGDHWNRVIKGSSFETYASDKAHVHSASRRASDAILPHPEVGFRLAR